MELKLLEDFICLDKLGTFSDAAEARHVSQPAFSRRIKALENWVGTGLIDRTSNPIQLTAQGIRFKEIAEDTVQQLYGIRDELQECWAQTEQSVSFATLDSLSTSFFPKWFGSLKENCLVTGAQLYLYNLDDCIKSMNRGDCDFILCYYHQWAEVPLDTNKTPCIILDYERLIPVCLPDKDGKPLFDWSGDSGLRLPFLSYSKDCYLGQVVHEILSKIRTECSIKTIYENSTATSLMAMVECGYGVAWIPERLVRKKIDCQELCLFSEYNWIPPLEIRLYKAPNRKRKIVNRFWENVCEANLCRSVNHT